MSKREPDSTETIAVLEKNQRETVHVRILEYHGRQFVDLRVFSGTGDRPLPTKKGLAFPIEQTPALIEALGRVGEAAYGAEDDPLTRQYRATMAQEIETMTDHDTARTDTRRRQREIADRVLADAGTNGATRADVNAALAAAGLPVLETEAEWIGLHDDEPVAELSAVLGAG